MTLINAYMTNSLQFDNRRWAVYDYKSHKKLTHDFGALRGPQEMDDFVVVSLKINYTKRGEEYFKAIAAPHDQAPIEAYY